MKSNAETVAILKDMAQEFNIVRAGRLAIIRINDQAIKILQEHPELITKQEINLYNHLDFRLHHQKTVKVLSDKIEELKTELDSPESEIDVIEKLIRIYRIIST